MTDASSTPTPAGRKQRSHVRIVEAAAQAVRRSGCAALSVADVMQQAGLTHGGFYAHFASRDAMLAEAVDFAARAGGAVLARESDARQARGASPLRALVESYLRDEHLAAPEAGCVVAALSSELPRQSPEVLAVSAARVRDLVARVQQALPAPRAKETALAVASTLVGALQLARTLGLNAQGRAVLTAARKAVLEQHDRT